MMTEGEAKETFAALANSLDRSLVEAYPRLVCCTYEDPFRRSWTVDRCTVRMTSTNLSAEFHARGMWRFDVFVDFPYGGGRQVSDVKTHTPVQIIMDLVRHGVQAWRENEDALDRAHAARMGSALIPMNGSVDLVNGAYQVTVKNLNQDQLTRLVGLLALEQNKWYRR